MIKKFVIYLKYLKFFWVAILLIFIAAICWQYIPVNFNNFRSGLISSILGVGIALFAAEGFKDLDNHKKIKKTFGLLRLVTIPYLKNQSENFIKTAVSYQDICTKEKAISFIALMSNLNEVEKTFDRSWLQMVLSQDFIDAIKSDDQFNKIAHAILELLLFIGAISTLSVNAKVLMMNDPSKLTEEQSMLFITKAKEFRNQLSESACSLQKYINQLDQEMEIFFLQNNVIYQEFER